MALQYFGNDYITELKEGEKIQRREEAKNTNI